MHVYVYVGRDLRACLDDLVPKNVGVRGHFFMVTFLRAAVVDQAPLVFVLLGVEDEIAACVCIYMCGCGCGCGCDMVDDGRRRVMMDDVCLWVCVCGRTNWDKNA